MVVLHLGGRKDGYNSHTTRTIHVGEPTEEEQTVHDTVRTAQQSAVEATVPGVTCQEINRRARGLIEDAGYGEYATELTGHGIGITAHEPPYLTESEETCLVPGMCLSIGSGVYLPGRFGVRITDVVTCTEDGGRRLNSAEHGMTIVE
jgi:D-alanyl-D-alanine dipeptidase